MAKVKHNPASRVGGKGVTLRNMASITIKRLPGGAVAITGRKLAGTGRAYPGRRKYAAESEPWQGSAMQYAS